MKTAIKLGTQCALLVALSIASSSTSADWCTGKDYYLIDMELADRLIKGQEDIRKQQKAIHRTQLQLQYDDTAPAETLKQQLHTSVLSRQKQTQMQCEKGEEKQTDLRLQVTQLIHYKQLYSRLDKALKTHKTIGNELGRANDELQIVHTALQANQSLNKALNTISAACLTVKYSQKVIDKFQPIDVKSIKESQHNVDHLQAVMDQYQLLSLPSNTLCKSISTFGIKQEKIPVTWWQKVLRLNN
ncbi:MAG TPA: hypothetical protein EYG71_07815 [Leucothrix sp.]|nr:hypothetical protein [Leucothrix sp.]